MFLLLSGHIIDHVACVHHDQTVPVGDRIMGLRGRADDELLIPCESSLQFFTGYTETTGLRRVITRHTLDPALGIQADVAHLGRQDRGRQQSLLVWQ